MDIELLKYPIGKFKLPDNITLALRQEWVERIATLPLRLEKVLQPLADEQLDTPYRPGGWTVRQLVHHIADSHTNAHCRLRLALTEDQPTIKPYAQEHWANLPDARQLPIEPSLIILKGIHQRWVALLNSLDESQFKRTYFHPEDNKTYSVEWMTGLYAWHGDHHLAHITSLLGGDGW